MQSSTSKLRVTNKELRSHLGIYDRKALKWDPVGFQVESQRLEAKLYPASVQQSSLDSWLANPKRAQNYIVAGTPDDRDARYFAAYLAQIHMEALGLNARVRWESVIGNFQNPAMQEEPSLLILTNLTPRSSNVKYEKVRDLIERHSSIPKIIVVAGEDPISFAATRLYVPCHALAYFGSSISKSFTEVV